MAQSPDKIRTIAFDIDGVMTDGSLIALGDGDLLRIFNAKDSFAVRAALAKGLDVAVITGGVSDCIKGRCRTLGIPEANVYMGRRDKINAFNSYCERTGVLPEEILYFGDDIPDIAVMKACGISIAPSDAVEEVKAVADIVSDYPGGKRCVRNGIEMVMKAQGKWHFNEEDYTRE